MKRKDAILATTALITLSFAVYQCVANPASSTNATTTDAGQVHVVRASSATALGPIIPPSWTYPQWYVDPSNASGNASDNNNCTMSSTPCLTWHEINDHRWGCQGSPIACPRLRQTTTITFLSSHTDTTDPVYFLPAIETTGTVSIQGTAPTVAASGVILSGTTAKSRVAGANSLLITNLGASGAPNQLVQNITHPSRAWAFKSLGSNSFSMTQPITSASVPGASTPPAEVDSWVNGDSVNLLQPVAINLVVSNPTFSETNPATTFNVINLYQFNVLNPSAPADQAYFGPFNLLQEMSVSRVSNIFNGYSNNSNTLRSYNVIFPGSINSTSSFWAFGGYMSGTLSNAGGPTLLDEDVIVTEGGIDQYGGEMNLSLAYLDKNIRVHFGRLIGESSFFGGPVIYGAASQTISILGASHFSIFGGTFTSAFTAPALISPGVLINSAATACSHTNASPDVANCGITTTPAHLDAAAGVAGFGGNAYNPGGASVANF
jgi:hypothetical protein